ncbi:PQQ-dependent sugar dehydrogenase [Cohnella nanjingensis]|uniref:PQQ-dependent sugar dehydrogenase n=1 Tax=Cohnella nanjingensis TaxID=1387779 RepID=A0A7X0RKX9_9BACL|nr:PQQ-dependent sugar dehydrogenase [Cohnella nanjingensis]MBB6669402.1 PQQ-dependent sugar dehydrogenase [Cohnella nanjingensis]
MKDYIPNGMVQKQYRWEWANHFLYQYLQRNNPFPKLRDAIAGLLNEQEKQLSSLQKLAASQGIRIPPTTIKLEIKNILGCIKDLYDREYQLLQEYRSYAEYFLAASSRQLGIKNLVDSQIDQVNMLAEFKQAFSELSPEEDRKERSNYVLEKGYRLERVATGLTFPTVMTFDSNGMIYIAEAGFAYGTEPGKGRILRLEKDGSLTEFAGGFGGPVTGIAWHEGHLYVAAGAIGEEHGSGCGQIIRISEDGKRETIVTGLRTCGDHYTGDILFGSDGKLYFSVGTATNSAVVGLDNKLILKYHPKFHETPARDLVLAGTNFITRNPSAEPSDVAVTGAYKPYGTASHDGEIVRGRLSANGVVYCCDPDGSHLQIVADGFRNTFGLRFSPFNGKLVVIDHGADPRGSRQIRLDWDKMWEVTPGGWYGFPEIFSGLPVTLPHFHASEQAKPTFILKEHPPLACQPIVRFQPHSASMKFDFCTNTDFGHAGEIFVAQFGESGFEKTEELPGYKVVRVKPDTGQIANFLVNPQGESAAEGPIRPIDVKFSPDGNVLYVVDLGILGSTHTGKKPQPNTGGLWKIVKVK